MEFTMQQLQDKFAELYGTEGEPKAYFAPGRVNLIVNIPITMAVMYFHAH